MDFKEQKQNQLSLKDKSSIGSWDEKIKGLCDKLNKNAGYYTTSSCAGRVVLIKGLDKKARDVFLFRSHDKISFKELKRGLLGIGYDDLVYFKQSPCILHVACKDLKNADDLVKKAKLAGWKHSGVMGLKKRILVELVSTERIEFPIMNNKEILVDDDFLKLIVKEANKKLERVWGKIKKLQELL